MKKQSPSNIEHFGMAPLLCTKLYHNWLRKFMDLYAHLLYLITFTSRPLYCSTSGRLTHFKTHKLGFHETEDSCNKICRVHRYN